MSHFLTVLTAPNPDALFSNWQTTIMQWVRAALTNILVPVGIVVLLGALIFCLIRFFSKRKDGHGDEVNREIMGIILCLIGIAILATSSVWLPFISGGYL